MARTKLKTNEKFFASFFSGGGGFDYGLVQSGFIPIFFSDIDRACSETHKLNFPDVPFICEDINKITERQISTIVKKKKVSLICGGPPCQGFTNMGDKLGADPRNSSLFGYMRMVRLLNPDFVVLENVPGLQKKFDGAFYNFLLSELANLGYQINSRVVNFHDWGVPQIRKRLIIIASKFGRVSLDAPLKLPIKKTLSPKRTVGEALKGLSAPDSANVDNHSPLNHGQVVIDRYKLIKPGGKLPPPNELPVRLRRGNFGNTYQRLDPNLPATTMVPGNNAFPVHPREHRSLTPREAARIQSFPDPYTFSGSRAQQCHQVGNAVPPYFAFVLGDRLQKALNGKTEAFAAEGELLASISKVSRKRSLPGADKLRVVDLFCGVGGFSIGFENAGFDVILKADNNPHVAESVRANFPHSDFVHGDLSEAFTKRLIKKKVGSQKIDVLVGGPPCQGFSIYGKRRFMREGHGSDARNDLVFTFVNYAEMLDPDWVIMENVPGIESYADGAYVRSIVKRLQALGFTRVEYKVLNAADFGVPQLRRRFILIATKTNLVLPWPKPKFHSDPKSWQKKHRSIAEVITDLTHVGDDCFDNHIFPKHHLIVSERYKFIKQGEKLNPSVLPGHLRLGMKTGKEVKQYSKVAFRLHPDRPAPTMVPGHNAFPVHPTENRTLTIREVARIQTFPDHITFKGTVIERGLQVGNAFPPLLAQVIAERLRRIVINQWGEDTVTKLAKYTMLD